MVARTQLPSAAALRDRFADHGPQAHRRVCQRRPPARRRRPAHGFALKQPPVDADSLNWEHRLLAQLNQHLPEALAPVQALDGSTWFWFHDRPVWLTRWAPDQRAGPDDRLAVATVLGRLHASPVEPSTRPNHARLLQQPLPPLRRIPASLAPWRTVIAQARTDLERAGHLA